MLTKVVFGYILMSSYSIIDRVHTAEENECGPLMLTASAHDEQPCQFNNSLVVHVCILRVPFQHVHECAGKAAFQYIAHSCLSTL